MRNFVAVFQCTNHMSYSNVWRNPRCKCNPLRSCRCGEGQSIAIQPYSDQACVQHPHGWNACRPSPYGLSAYNPTAAPHQFIVYEGSGNQDPGNQWFAYQIYQYIITTVAVPPGSYTGQQLALKISESAQSVPRMNVLYDEGSRTFTINFSGAPFQLCQPMGLGSLYYLIGFSFIRNRCTAVSTDSITGNPSY